MGQSPLSCSYGFILPPEKLLLTKFSPAPTTFTSFLGKSTHTLPSGTPRVHQGCWQNFTFIPCFDLEAVCMERKSSSSRGTGADMKHSAQPELLPQWENFKESTWKQKRKQIRVTFSSGSTEMRSRNGDRWGPQHPIQHQITLPSQSRWAAAIRRRESSSERREVRTGVSTKHQTKETPD